MVDDEEIDGARLLLDRLADRWTIRIFWAFCPDEALELSPLEACMQLSLFGSTYVRLAGDGAPEPLTREEARFRAVGKGPWVAEASGFNVHAGVTVRSGDREGLTRLCRYGARPPFTLERLRDPCSLAARGRRPSASAATARTPCGAARGRASGTAS